MIISDISELAPLILNGLTAGLLNEIFTIQKLPLHIKWIAYFELENSGPEYAISQGWNPDTSLMLYTLPPDYNSDKDIPYSEIKGALINLSKLNSAQCTCMFFQDMTLEKLAGLINQIIKMKAFL